DIQADISPLAARINVAPVHKLKTIISSMSASLLIHLTEMLLLLIFLRFVLQVDFGSKIGFVILTTVIGSIAGVTFGALISALVKKSEGIKVAILIGVTMFGSFLAGMMYQNMKYIVAQKIPVLSYLNPVNLLTDAFYCLYYYDTFSRYALNMGILSIFIVIFCVGTYSIIRRRKYASL
ncbi:MAG: ABC transporter permease, partial [Syntrophaceticus sp.]|nr:ABC transporter permease [Syntrophaceticus sp.]